MNWATEITDLLWRGALGAIPLALIVAAICRWPSLRPGTRHALWVVVLIAFVAPLGTSYVSIPDLNSLRVDTTPLSPTDAGVGAETPPPIGVASDLSTRYDDQPGGIFVDARPVEREAATSMTAVDAALPLATPVFSEIDDLQIGVTSPEPAPTAENNSAKTTGAPPSWRIWAAALVGVRDAIAAIPTLPAPIWLCGAAGVFCLYIVSVARFRRRLRGATRVPEPVEREINRISREISLGRPPQALMVNDSISPMVWCGRRPRLILPSGLWAQLDRDGRRAILCHELAHLRRRDHWVRWLELAVSVLFWWHPLLWWVRRRVHEEADICCDAWVTWLMPRRRREYAEALLTARAYVGAGVGGAPATAMGAMTKGTKRFARRITMVMTKTSLPRSSAAGMGVACMLALAGWIVTPAWSYPPMGSSDDGVVMLTSCPEPAPECDESPEAALAEIEYIIQATPDSDDLRARLAQLEEQVQRLSGRLGVPPAAPRAPAAARMPRMQRITVVPPVPPVAPVAPMPSAGVSAALNARGFPGYAPFGVSEGETLVRTYKLPKEKLELLTKLMVRNDVPIPVRQVEGGIEVHATAGQQRVFEAFCEMIHPTGKKSGLHSALPGARVFSDGDVTWFAEGDEKVKAYVGRAQEHYVDLRRDHAQEAEERAELGAHRAYADGLKLYKQFSEDQTELLGGLAEQLAEQSEELEAQAEELRAQAEELQAEAEESDEADPDQLKSLRAAVRELEAQARRLEAQARQMEKKAQKHERSNSKRKPTKAGCNSADSAL